MSRMFWTFRQRFYCYARRPCRRCQTLAITQAKPALLKSSPFLGRSSPSCKLCVVVTREVRNKQALLAHPLSWPSILNFTVLFLGRVAACTAKAAYSHKHFPLTICRSVCLWVCLSVCLSSALWKNGRSGSGSGCRLAW